MNDGNGAVIALLTDFGTADAYVAVMKGVILGIAPGARLVDLTHEITPQRVQQAAYVLLTAGAYFPAGTIFLCIVDPGVGTQRRAIAVETVRGRFVGPDNGLFSYALAESPPVAQVEITNPAYRLPQPSHTFHGRDIFAPAAAHLARGVPLAALGPPVSDIERLPAPRLAVSGDRIGGEVIHIDHFGNVVTSVGSLTWREDGSLWLAPRFGARRASTVQIPASSAVIVAGATLEGIRPSYGHTAPGAALALVNSAGQLEVAVSQGNAAQTLGAAVGDPVTVRLK